MEDNLIYDYMNDIATCREVCVTYRRGLDWIIGFTDTLSIHLVTTNNYSAIVIPTLYRSLLHMQ
jgi:hypothetical protein